MVEVTEKMVEAADYYLCGHYCCNGDDCGCQGATIREKYTMSESPKKG